MFKASDLASKDLYGFISSHVVTIRLCEREFADAD